MNEIPYEILALDYFGQVGVLSVIHKMTPRAIRTGNNLSTTPRDYKLKYGCENRVCLSLSLRLKVLFIAFSQRFPS